nr:hypothetical protein [Listeria monocytogenes]
MNYLLGKNSAHITFKKSNNIYHCTQVLAQFHIIQFGLRYFAHFRKRLQLTTTAADSFLIFFVKKEDFHEKSAFFGDNLF